MREASFKKLTLLAIIVGHLTIQCDATAFSLQSCVRVTFGFEPHNRRCPPPRLPASKICSLLVSLCNLYPDFRDCLLPQFQCVGNLRCIPRTRYCNGIKDCSDGSDEWGCDTTSSDSTITNTMHSESEVNTFSYITTASTILPENGEKTTSVILSASEDDTSSPPPPSTTTSTILPHSEPNIAFSSSMTKRTILPHSESNTAFSSSTTTSTTFPNSESNIAFPSSLTTSNAFPSSESNTALSSSTTAKAVLPAFGAVNAMLPESKGNISSPATITFPESSATHSCPDNYCMQNARCIVVQGQYRCKCPSSFIGELCEIQLGSEPVFHEHAVSIAICLTLVVFCLAVVSVGVYRYRRLSAWKSRDITSRALSQLTLTSNAVE